MQYLRYLLPFAKKYRWRLLLGLVFAVADGLLTGQVPQVVRLAVNDLNTRGVVAQELLRYGGILVLIAAIDSLFRFGLRLCIIGTSYLIELDLRDAMFRHLLVLDQSFYGRAHTGDLMTRVTNDLSAVRQFLGPGINSFITAVILLVVAGTLMLQTNVTLALIVLLLLPLVSVLFVVVGGRMRGIFRTVQDQFGDISTRAQENFSGIRTIKAYAQENAEIEVFRTENERYRALNLRYVLLSGLLWPAITLVLGIVAALVLLVGGRFVAAGTLTLGDLVLFNTYLGLLTWPVISLGWMVNLYQQGAASMSRIAEVLYRAPQISTAPAAAQVTTLAGDVEFRDVGIRFDHVAAHGLAALPDAAPQPEQAAHETNGWMLRHISFQVPHGTSLAIVGSTGAGKTTLVNLLSRVRDPDEGAVLVDQHDVRQLPLDMLRHTVGYVPQDTFLFSVPMRENVTFGRQDASEQDIDHALAISRLSNDLSQFPNGIDTMIGERGVTLSGGQKQRTAIARAVLTNPAILVLDDALSSVDTHTAAEILAGLREIMRDRTSIIIAQRIATVKDANQIIVLHNGEIVERGTHRDLVARGERYAAMYRRELLEAELEEN